MNEYMLREAQETTLPNSSWPNLKTGPAQLSRGMQQLRRSVQEQHNYTKHKFSVCINAIGRRRYATADLG